MATFSLRAYSLGLIAFMLVKVWHRAFLPARYANPGGLV